MDKLFLLTYTCMGCDGFRHMSHSWFVTEEELRAFVQGQQESGSGFETELSIEILKYRRIAV